MTGPDYPSTIPRMNATRVIPASDNRLVWYAGFGSNLLRERFDCYIKGGKPKGSNADYAGCRDKSDVQGDQPIKLHHALYFADHSNAWNGAAAFVRPAASETTTYGRMYLITYGQLNDVVRQENGRDVPGNVIVPPYDEWTRVDHCEIAGFRLYGRLIKIGMQVQHPILTLTATRDDFLIGAPSEAYIKTIVAGLEETYPCLRKSEILHYLRQAQGIRDLIQGDVLAGWILGR